MIMGDKKKIAALIVARVKPGGDAEAMKAGNAKAFGERAKEAQDESGIDEGILSAAEEILSAVEAKDPRALARALTDFYSMCEDEDNGMEDDKEGKEEEEKPGILG